VQCAFKGRVIRFLKSQNSDFSIATITPLRETSILRAGIDDTLFASNRFHLK